MHYAEVSKNYPWLPHNVDPSIETPQEHKGKPVQHLGDKQSEYETLIERCVQHYGKKGRRCWENEDDRIAMNLRQPQSMVNYTKMVCNSKKTTKLLWKREFFSSSLFL